jgi:hypothetical protein
MAGSDKQANQANEWQMVGSEDDEWQGTTNSWEDKWWDNERMEVGPTLATNARRWGCSFFFSFLFSFFHSLSSYAAPLRATAWCLIYLFYFVYIIKFN